jgi:O-glycosyl hydrolase
VSIETPFRLSADLRSSRVRLPWLVTTLAIALLTVATAAGRRGLAPATHAEAGTVAVRIDSGLRHQVMEGFGATTLPLVYGDLDPLPAALRQRAIEAVYRDIGLRTGNVEQAVLESPGDYAARRNDNDDPFVADPAGFQSGGLVRTRDKLLTPAFALGFDGYLAQKINLRWASPWLVPIRAADRRRYLDEAAEQVLMGARAWRDIVGREPRLLHLFNEPTSGNGELQGGDAAEIVDLIIAAGDRLRADGFAAPRFVVANEETERRSLEVARAIVANPAALAYVGALGYHPYPYGSTYASVPNILRSSGSGKPDPAAVKVRAELRDLAKTAGVPLWMTEVSHGELDPRSFDALRGRAVHIHDELTMADASAYFGMNNMWDSFSQAQHFAGRDQGLYSEADSLVLIDLDLGKVVITGMGYAIGHWARFLPRGAVRVAADAMDPLVQVSAFLDEAGGRLVLVAINNATEARTVDVAAVGLQLRGELSGIRSTETERWAPLAPLPTVQSGGFADLLPAHSVTTYVADLAGAAVEPTATAAGVATATPMTVTPSPTTAATAAHAPSATPSLEPSATPLHGGHVLWHQLFAPSIQRP